MVLAERPARIVLGLVLFFVFSGHYVLFFYTLGIFWAIFEDPEDHAEEEELQDDENNISLTYSTTDYDNNIMFLESAYGCMKKVYKKDFKKLKF